MRYSPKFINSKSQSENIKDKQEIPSVKLCDFRRVLQEREVQQERMSQSFPNMGHSETRSRVQLQTEELMTASLMEKFQETSASEMQAVKALKR